MSKSLTHLMIEEYECSLFSNPVSVEDFLDTPSLDSIHRDAQSFVRNKQDSETELAIFRTPRAKFQKIQQAERIVDEFDGEYHIYGSSTKAPQYFLVIVVREK